MATALRRGVAVATTLALVTAAQARGATGQIAPKWDIEKWINLPEGEESLDIGDFRGKVLYLFTFQSW